MTVLVTGGAGYIGSHMVLALRDAGRAVVVLDDLSTGFRDLVPDGVPLVRGDIGDADLVAATLAGHGVTAIVHFAGSIVVPDSVKDPLGYYLNNTVKSRALLAAAVAGGVKHFIFSSTAAVYGEPETSPIDETAATAPISPYGASKLMTEWMLRDTAAAHGLTYAALRYFNVAGADPQRRAGQSFPRATHLIKLAAQAALGERPYLEIFGEDYPTPDGTCIRDYVHVSDLARAHLLALEHLEAGGESLVANCGYGRGYSVREVIAAVKRVSGIDFPVLKAARRPGDPAALVAGVTRIGATLGFRPALDHLDTIVADALAWEEQLRRRRDGAAPLAPQDESRIAAAPAAG
ncbi:UDP-glucose 4-epimerase GalE [Prosthecomicrobium pneumaticum]|uniref:UDP-glucose 4-epimerase n=1 Tax=Prosthecomicrobium pneumaticum TaxID=81895 RepID=A0A7W9L227_9HYPH|nr:UDP-glucose 4-epimerase GalE [Prosthecomicrobium pneumaticum]MBB5753230.1 UDP-glucose 4-epimerase [Prosthecomicrobium pneumaticum]